MWVFHEPVVLSMKTEGTLSIIVSWMGMLSLTLESEHDAVKSLSYFRQGLMGNRILENKSLVCV